MPRLALALCALWFAALFVFRTIHQWRKTGTTGLKGFHGRPGSVPWIAGVCVSLGFLCALLSPLAALFSWPGGRLLFEHAGLHVLGAVLMLSGTCGTLLAQLSMGDSWRVGVDESEQTRLVTEGLFAQVRNPIFSFMGLSLVGLVLLLPNAAALLGGLFSYVGIELQVRRVEEPYLASVHGSAYRAYAARVGRFAPGIGRIPELPPRLYALCFYVPESHVEAVKRAVFDAGAGRIGDYRCCAWQVRGTGQFEPMPGSTPFIGETDRLERVDEIRVEMICEDASIPSVIRALKDAHPYEEPAFHYWRVNEDVPGDPSVRGG